MKKQITIPVFVPHLGCPHQCTFCNQNKITGKDAPLPQENFEDLITTYRSKISPDTHVEIAFFGGSFTAIETGIQEAYLEKAFSAKKEKLVDEIRLSTRPDAIGSEVITRLKKYSVDTVELGVQSFNDRVLTASRRGHTVADVLDAVERLKAAQLKVGIQLMPGLPEDSSAFSIESAKKTIALHADCVRIYPTVVIADTPLEKLYLKGEYSPLSLEQAVETSAAMYSLFRQSGILVIRMGLPPFDKDEEVHVIAGPYHPAFGFLVKARVKRKKIEEKLTSFFDQNHPRNSKMVRIRLPHVEYEEYIGMKRENITYLEKIFSTKISYLRDDTISGPEIEAL